MKKLYYCMYANNLSFGFITENMHTTVNKILFKATDIHTISSIFRENIKKENRKDLACRGEIILPHQDTHTHTCASTPHGVGHGMMTLAQYFCYFHHTWNWCLYFVSISYNPGKNIVEYTVKIDIDMLPGDFF